MRFSSLTYSSSVAVAALLCGAGPAGAGAPEDFERFCAPCHGSRGDGRGPVALLLPVPPRDFTPATFKFRSTASGELPLDADILRVIEDGLPGTAMAGWRAVLPAPRRAALVAVVKSFSPRFAAGPAPQPVPLPARPPADPGAASRGRQIYERMGCAACHGPGGRGDGPSMPGLRDDRGRPIPPSNLTDPLLLRARDEEDVVRVLLTGLDGTPMPSYGDALGAADAWDLARFVASIRRAPSLWRRVFLEPPLTWSTTSKNRRAVRRFFGVLGTGERRRALPAGARWGAGRRERQRAASLLNVRP